MTQDFIDFGNFSRKILINPCVILQILELYCRNEKKRVQATLLGKVYSNAIEILQIVPVDICQNNQIKKLDYLQHSKSIENILTVYTNLMLLGVIVTNLQPDKNLAILHTTYSNKESGFKAQGILIHPIILSLRTQLKKDSKNFDMDCFCLSQSFLFCKDLMGITSFQRLKVTTSFGDSDIESMAPLFQAVNDGEEFVPRGGVENLIKSLISLLKKLKSGNNEKNENAKIKRLLDRLRVQHDYSIEELAYIMEYGSLQRRITQKISTIKD